MARLPISIHHLQTVHRTLTASRHTSASHSRITLLPSGLHSAFHNSVPLSKNPAPDDPPHAPKYPALPYNYPRLANSRLGLSRIATALVYPPPSVAPPKSTPCGTSGTRIPRPSKNPMSKIAMALARSLPERSHASKGIEGTATAMAMAKDAGISHATLKVQRLNSIAKDVLAEKRAELEKDKEVTAKKWRLGLILDSRKGDQDSELVGILLRALREREEEIGGIEEGVKMAERCLETLERTEGVFEVEMEEEGKSVGRGG